jgi:hypothetical protein
MHVQLPDSQQSCQEQIKDLNVRSKTLKLLGGTLQDTDTGNDFLNGTPIAQGINSRTDKWITLTYKAAAQQRRQSTEYRDRLVKGR